ncbi:MAG TPA: hypothetical protein VJ851_18875 [Jatrophihabitans sp.]|nr:hypothetical protein [Jatrophihabitans sp.]
MATLPTPLKAAIGLAATALDEARKLPETLPQAPVVAVSTAMQVSLRVQQRIAALAARGEEVISQLRGASTEPPDWATFDDSPDQASAGGSRGATAFDRVPDGTDAPEPELGPSLAEVGDRFAPTEVGGTEPTKPAKKTAGAGKAAAAKASPAKAAAGGAKSGKANPTKAAKQPRTRSEPLIEAAKRAKPSAAPNPTTMAAEIVHAHEVAGQDGSAPAQSPGAGSGTE